MSTRKLWGEFEDTGRDSNVIQTVNFNPIIELAMQNIPEIPITVKSSPIELPKPNLITHTIQLHAYAERVSEMLDKAENSMFDGARLDALSIPTLPPEPILKLEHKPTTPVNFYEKDYCDFSVGNGPVILPFTPESHQRAIKQCAAIAISHIGIDCCTSSALAGVTDALDYYMTNMCKLLRTVVDREASGTKSGFPDAISKVFADLNVGNLHDFYQNKVVQYHAKIRHKCNVLRAQCEKVAIGEIATQLKLEEVPELHFPAALDGSFTTSLEPGFQMLHSLEQDQLQGLDLLDSKKDIKTEVMDAQIDVKSVNSPNAKKIRK